jgi:hypothetical protein
MPPPEHVSGPQGQTNLRFAFHVALLGAQPAVAVSKDMFSFLQRN